MQERNISIINNEKEKQDKPSLVVCIIQAFRLGRQADI